MEEYRLLNSSFSFYWPKCRKKLQEKNSRNTVVRWIWNNFLNYSLFTEKLLDLVRKWKNLRAWKKISWKQIKLWRKTFSQEKLNWLTLNIFIEEVKSNNNYGIMNSVSLILIKMATLLHMILLIVFLFTSHSNISKSMPTILIQMIINTCIAKKFHLMISLLSNTSLNRNISLSTKFWAKVKSTQMVLEKLQMNLPKNLNSAMRPVPKFQLHALAHS